MVRTATETAQILTELYYERFGAVSVHDSGSTGLNYGHC